MSMHDKCDEYQTFMISNYGGYDKQIHIKDEVYLGGHFLDVLAHGVVNFLHLIESCSQGPPVFLGL